ncbi:MAG: FKBP-type peptidyl-prolyl cis-trans isomerase [Spirochaetota bacterium]|nr:FKBP-type peptidyl-prolyl cis-trans isomerase [Spirochaetota bacterium]
MLKVNSNDTIRIHYNLTLDDDSVIENSFGGDPLEFTIGDNQLIPGLEKSVIGMCKNESKTFKIPMDEAHGPYLDEKIVVVARDELSKDIILA